MSVVQRELDRPFFSGQEDDFVFFAEQFEARMYAPKLKDVFDQKVEVDSVMPILSYKATEQQSSG